MATESFTTDLKFNRKSITKVLNAMEKEKEIKTVHVNSEKITNPDTLTKMFFKSIK